MDFDEVVSGIVNSAQGSLAAVIMDRDGIPLAEYKNPQSSVDVITLGIEYTAVLGEIMKASEVLETGKLEELTVRSGGLIFVIRLINDDFFIAAAIAPGGNYGKGRYLMRIAAPKIAEEL